eukprot:828999-Pyramimonas_sp.AAC.1
MVDLTNQRGLQCRRSPCRRAPEGNVFGRPPINVCPSDLSVQTVQGWACEDRSLVDPGLWGRRDEPEK